jgi:hypothetical protein
MSAPASDDQSTSGVVTFTADIKPLFRASDREAMQKAFDLWAYDDVVAHAAAISGKLHDGTMPCDGPWPANQLDLFDRWRDGGTPE